MTRRTLISAALLLVISLAVVFSLISLPALLPPASSMQESMADMPGMEEKGGEGSSVKREEKGGAVENSPGMVTIPPEQQQAIGLRTVAVEQHDMTRVIRTVGRVDVDERTLTHVTIKLDGYIEQLYAHSTGERVTKGQPLFELYSPDLVATQQEYLLALKSAQSLGGSAIPEVAEGAKTLLEVTHRRLELWDIREDQIKALERTGQVQKTMPIYSPVTGTVIKKVALHGMHVKPGDELYHIADLSRVWVFADIYEYEQPYVKVGQSATVSSLSVAGAPLKGQIGFIYPTLDPTTRTAKVRLEFPNPNLRLKPEMYADVEIRVEMGKMIAVPEDAVLDTGLRQLVFVERRPGMFEPREVTLGPKAGGYVAVTTGVSPGGKVAVGANFLLDAESKLKSAGGMQGMMGRIGMGDWQMRGAYESKKEGMKGMDGMKDMK